MIFNRLGKKDWPKASRKRCSETTAGENQPSHGQRRGGTHPIFRWGDKKDLGRQIKSKRKKKVRII